MVISKAKTVCQPICDYSHTNGPVSEEQVEQHALAHPGKGARCENCNRFFTKEWGLSCHLSNGHCSEMNRALFEETDGSTAKFEVEYIADVAGKEGKPLFYKVKWVGYELNWNREKGEKTAWEHSRLLDGCDEALKEFWDSREDKPEDDIPFDDVRWGRHLHFCYDCGKVFGRKQDLTGHQTKSRTDPNACWGKTPPSRSGSKTEYDIRVQRKIDLANTLPKIEMGETELANTFIFKYLGVDIPADGDWSATPKKRMAIARKAFNEMYPLWIDKNLPKKLKLHLYEASVLSILTHGCEAWSLTGKGGKGGLQATLKGWNARCLVTLSRTDDESIEGEEMGLRIRQECNAPTIDINRKIRHRRFRWLGQILRLEKDQNNKTRLLKQAVLQMEKPYPPGSILMDVPPHESMEDLVDYAHDFDRWSIWTNAILDPEHA